MNARSGIYSRLKRIEIRRSGRAVLAVLGIGVILIVARGCGWFPAAESTRGAVGRESLDAPHALLRVGIYPGAEFTPGLVENGGLETNRESAYRARHSLNIRFVLVEDPARSLAMLASGGLDIAWATPDTLAGNYRELSAANPVAFLHCGWSQGREMIIAGPGIASPSGIRGKTIACAEHSPSHFFALYALRIAGLDARDLRWRYTLTPEDAARLFSRGGADMCVTNAHAGRAAMKKRSGSTILLSTSEVPRLIATIFVARESLLISRGDLVRGFIRGWLEGASEVGRDRDSAVTWMSRAFGFEPSEAGPDFEIASISDYAANLSFFGLGGENSVGFGCLFDRSRALRYGKKSGEEPIPAGIAMNADLLSSLFDETPRATSPARAGKAGPSPPGGWKIHSQVFAIVFEKNSASPDFDSLARLRTVAEAAAVYRNCVLLARALDDPSEESWRNLASRRVQEIVSIASRDYGISPERFHEIRNAPPPRKAAAGGRVEIVIASPQRAE